jgi:AP endonuclease-1
MARKQAPPSDSSLSPPPNDNVVSQQTETEVSLTTKINGQGKKRKAVAETSVKTTKRSRNSAVKAEAVNGEEEIKVTEKEDGQAEVKMKKKRTAKKKEANLVPLEERTEGSKLLVGAHVSIAGGIAPLPSFSTQSQDLC